MQHNYWKFQDCENSKSNQEAYKNSKDEVKMQSTSVISNEVEINDGWTNKWWRQLRIYMMIKMKRWSQRFPVTFPYVLPSSNSFLSQNLWKTFEFPYSSLLIRMLQICRVNQAQTLSRHLTLCVRRLFWSDMNTNKSVYF